MSGSAVMTPIAVSKVARQSNFSLLAGGYFSLAFAVFQITAIWWSPGVISYMGGPAQMGVEEPFEYAVLCVLVAGMVGIFGLYALSGAGKLRRFPLLRSVLIGVTAIYLLRGLMIIPQVPLALKHPELVRFLTFSLLSLFVGTLHLVGVVSLYRYGRPGEGTFAR